MLELLFQHDFLNDNSILYDNIYYLLVADHRRAILCYPHLARAHLATQCRRCTPYHRSTFVHRRTQCRRLHPPRRHPTAPLQQLAGRILKKKIHFYLANNESGLFYHIACFLRIFTSYVPITSPYF